MTLNPLFIGAVLASAFVMLFFNYMSKNKEESEQFKVRRIAKLNKRAGKLDSIISGLPPSYLPRTLRELIYSSIIESLQQVFSLTGNETTKEQIANIRKTLSSISGQAGDEPVNSQQSESIADTKECKYLLKDLYNLILEFHAEGLIKRDLAETHLAIVRSLLLKVSLETYRIAALGALEANNTGLALHYCEMAKSRLDQDLGASGLEKERKYFNDQVLTLAQRAQREEAKSQNIEGLNDADPEVLAQWQALKTSDEDWKKKRY